MSNPRPGTMISTPVFGYELFVAQINDDTIHDGDNRKLSTINSPVAAMADWLHRH
jgi:hypothetical protein